MPTRAALLEQGHTNLCFDDILLTPQYSGIESRNDPDIGLELGHINLDIPILSSPMDSITGLEMLKEMNRAGGLGILTRFIGNPDEAKIQARIIREAKQEEDIPVGCALGIKHNVTEHVEILLDAGCDLICLDVAHGDLKKMYEAIKQVNKIREKHKFGCSLMAGNVCTPEATNRFINAGVDIIKVGIGPGAACTTRRVTGFGMPQLSAVLRCAAAVRECRSEAQIVADGGLRTTGDMVKALWAGADACMVGFMLAGTSATPDIDGDKTYRGMSSRTVHGRKDVAAEGIDIKINYRGTTSDKLTEYKQGIRSGFAMGGARDISGLRDVKCVRASTLTMKESDPL